MPDIFALDLGSHVGPDYQTRLPFKSFFVERADKNYHTNFFRQLLSARQAVRCLADD